MKRIDIFKELELIKNKYEQEKKHRKEWQKKYSELNKKYHELSKKLDQILNSNIPSSQLPFTEKNTNRSPNRAPKGTNPRGKPKGGKGGTRPFPKHFDKEEKATTTECNKCNSTNLKHIHTEKMPVWDLPVIKMVVTLFYVFIYRCENCGKIVYGRHPDLPKKGMIGPRLASFLLELRQNFAVSYGKLSVFLEDLTGETFSGQAIKDCVKRVAKKLEPSYNKFREKLKNEKVLNSDETKWPVNGDHFYLWLLCALDFVFIEIINSRARKVLTNLLGEQFTGVIISDCLAVYLQFAVAFQKCWAHLLRKTFWLKKKHPKSDITQLHKQLSDLFDEAKKYIKSKLKTSDCIWATILLNQKLQRIMNYNWKSEASKGIIKNWLKKFEGQWLVGVMMPEVELTNNKNERGIRKVIPIRKLLGGHRSEAGAKDFAIIETHRQTWRHRGESPYNKMVEFLENENRKSVVV